MSYTIFYDKLFIRLSNNKFVPMIQMGDNNVYEAGRGNRDKRARSWENYHGIGLRKSYTLAEMLQHCEELRADLIKRNEEWKAEHPDWSTYEDKSFGYYASLAIGGTTRNTTYGNYKGIFKVGTEKALTIEQLLEYNIGVRVYSSVYCKEALAKAGLEAFTHLPKTTAELEELIEKYDKLTAEYGNFYYIHYDNMDEYRLKNLRRNLFPKVTKAKKEIEVTKGYAIAIDAGYFVKFTRNGFRYSYSSYPPILTYDEKVAKRKLKKCLERIKKHNPKIEEVTLSHPKKVLI